MSNNTHTQKFCLPDMPSDWNDIPTDKLEEILWLKGKRHAEAATSGEEAADCRFRLNVLLCLLGVKILRQTVIDEAGEIVFVFRRKGLRHLFERIPMRAWQLSQWVDSKLKFLDNPTGRIATPYPYISLRYGTLKLKGPENMMGDVTFQQYLVAQNLLSSYWQTSQKLKEKIHSGAGRKEISQLIDKVSQLRCRFLATMFCPSVEETGEIREGRYVRTSKREVWAFSVHQTKENARYFRKVEKRMFPVMEQFYQSCQEAYSLMFPDLYTSSGKGNKLTNPIVQEVEMVNSVMKEQGFTSYDAVYDSEALRILGIMNSMCKKAKEIERMNQRMSIR